MPGIHLRFRPMMRVETLVLIVVAWVIATANFGWWAAVGHGRHWAQPYNLLFFVCCFTALAALHFALMNETDLVNEAMIYADAQKAGLNMAKLRADMQNPEIDAAIATSKALATRAGIDGTPTFIINGVMHPGAVDDDLLKSLAAQS